MNARLQALQAFIAQPKFGDDGALYTGVLDPAERQRFSDAMNALAEALVALAPEPEPKAALLSAFEKHWAEHGFEWADTEDRERALGYYEALMDVFGVSSSDGLLSRLMHGFDPEQTPADRNSAAWAAMSDSERALAGVLQRSTRAEALALLVQTFGPPPLEASGMSAWMLDAHGANTIGITDRSGAAILVWTVRSHIWSTELPHP